MNPVPGVPAVAIAIDDACQRLETAWRDGIPATIEEIFSRVSIPPEHAHRLFRELLLLELELRTSAGERPRPDDYTGRFPQFAAVIAEAFHESDATMVLEPGTTPPAAPPGGIDERVEATERYRVLRPLGQGGLGRLFRALDESFDREVALKEIKPERDTPDVRARFAREARLTGQLEHPGVVPVYGLGAGREGRPFYLMRLIKGRTLRDAIVDYREAHPAPDLSRHSLPLRDLLERFLHVCDTIDYAHSRGVVHRDLKPSNVMIGPFGETLVVDWGLAKVIGDSRGPGASADDHRHVEMEPGGVEDLFQTSFGRAVGTPHFMSPEQALGRQERVGPASDIYALGAVLYEILAGRPPYADSVSSEHVMRRVAVGDFPRPRRVQPRIPADLEAICLKAMALKAEDRYATARALADDLRRWLADEPVAAFPEPWLEHTRRTIRRHKVAFASSMTAFVASLIVGAPILLKHNENLVKARGLADAALLAGGDELPGFLTALGTDAPRVVPLLLEQFRDGPLTPTQKLRAAIVIGPSDPDVRRYMESRILDAELDVTPLLAAALRDDTSRLLGSCWRVVDDPAETGERKFRAAFALAQLDPPNSEAALAHWRSRADRIVGGMLDAVTGEPRHLGLVVKAFEPARRALFDELASRYRDLPGGEFDPVRIGRRITAAAILDHYAVSADDLAALMLDTVRGPRFDRYLARLRNLPDAEPALRRAFDADDSRIYPPDATDPDTTAGFRARRKARVAAVLALLGHLDSVWPLFRADADPTLRAELIVHFPRLNDALPAKLLERFPAEADLAVRRALVLGVGLLPAESVPDKVRNSAREPLLKLYAETPDPGLHSALGWFLRHRWDMGFEVDRIDREVASEAVPEGRDWFVNGQGQSFAVFRGVGATTIGSPPAEEGRAESETRHQVNIGRSFAIACRETTLAEYRRFLADAKETAAYLEDPEFRRMSRTDEAPVVGVSWYDAARYCNWLSRRAGLEESEWCYPADVRPGVRLEPAWLGRRGYRLPTEAEWEYACRAGAASSRPFGESWNNADAFGWFVGNAEGHFHAVARKLPNDFGLFDMLGNAAEWTHDSFQPFPAEASAPAPAAVVVDHDTRVVRGGSILLPPRPRSAGRDATLPANHAVDLGFRVARTCP